MSILDIASQWVDKGFSVIPISYRSKRPAFDALRLTASAVGGGLSWSEYKNRLPTAGELKLWFTGPKRNIGVVTGYNGLVVLDFDSLDFYNAWCNWAVAFGGEAINFKLNTFKVYSSRGVHVYIQCKELVESFNLEKSVDIKARWGYVLAPPSIHPNGHEYVGVGERIVECEHLSDVFPLGKPEPELIQSQIQLISDPWVAADQAITCNGQGAIERIHARLSISDMLGVNLGNRKSALVRCPLHNDKNPSMLVYADGHCRCLAGCNAGKQLDIVGLYAAMHHISNREAIAILDQT